MPWLLDGNHRIERISDDDPGGKKDGFGTDEPQRRHHGQCHDVEASERNGRPGEYEGHDTGIVGYAFYAPTFGAAGHDGGLLQIVTRKGEKYRHDRQQQPAT